MIEYGNSETTFYLFTNLEVDAKSFVRGRKAAGCFGEYFSSYVDDKDFYFSFPLISPYYTKVVEDFNSKMKNIKFEIIGVNGIAVSKRKDTWKNSTVITYEGICNTQSTEYSQPIFKLVLSKDYNNVAKKHLQYVLHHYLRMLSFTENVFIKDGDILDGDPMEFIIKINNRARGYRSLSEEELKVEDILNLDNIEEVNYKLNIIFEYFEKYSLRQTSILNFCSRIPLEQFKEAEKLLLKERITTLNSAEFVKGIGNYYNITNKDMELAVICEASSKNIFSIAIMRHPNLMEIGYKYRSLLTRQFEKVENVELTNEEKELVYKFKMQNFIMEIKNKLYEGEL